jgi:cytochrome c peroxidase
MEKRLFGLSVFIFCMSFTGLASALTNIEALGKFIYEDPVYSLNGNQSCQSCHHPNAQFSDPVNRIAPLYRPVSQGSDPTLFGGRNAPPSAYAAFNPPLSYDVTTGLFIGGLFWDGRASGIAFTGTGDLGAGPTFDPLADQAKGPFGNSVEMALVDDENGITEEKVVGLLKLAPYAKLYKKAFGVDIAAADVPTAYNNIALAISAFEKSTELNRFSSKFDKFSNEQGIAYVMTLTDANVATTPVKSTVYTAEEVDGLRLFNGKGQCSLCHVLDNQPDGKTPTVFTDFTYDNLGIPVNPLINTLAGEQATDLGLASNPEILAAAYGSDLPESVLLAQRGKFKVSSLRNIARTAPYGHNGYFPTLYDIVHFYNTRDTDPSWADPEVPDTVNDTELGDLGLTFEEEQKIVIFLETLTDL